MALAMMTRMTRMSFSMLLMKMQTKMVTIMGKVETRSNATGMSMYLAPSSQQARNLALVTPGT